MRTAFLHKYSYDSSLTYQVAPFHVQHTWYLVLGTSQHKNRLRLYSIRGTGVCFARKKTCQQLIPHYRCSQVLQAEQRLPHATEEKEKRSFPVECGSIAKDYPAWNSKRTQKSREVLCPEPEVVPRFSLGDVGEARWLLSHRWTETSPILPDVAHDSRNQRRVVSLSALSLLSACVRLRQLREVHHSLQQALNPWSRTQSAATDGSPVHL